MFILHENVSLKPFDRQLWVLCFAFTMILKFAKQFDPCLLYSLDAVFFFVVAFALFTLLPALITINTMPLIHCLSPAFLFALPAETAINQCDNGTDRLSPGKMVGLY